MNIELWWTLRRLSLRSPGQAAAPSARADSRYLPLWQRLASRIFRYDGICSKSALEEVFIELSK